MKQKTIKIGITGVNPFDGNRGVGALSYSIVYLLFKLSAQTGINFELYLIINGSNMPNNYTLDINGKQYDIHILPVVNIFSLKHFIKLLIYFKFFLMYFKLDYVLDAGYGDSYSDIYGKENFKQHNYIKRFFNLLGKKQMMLPQTIGPFFDNKVHKQAISAMSNMQSILARDKMSYNFVAQNVPKVHSTEIIDMAFFMPYTKDEYVNRKGFLNVGVGISKMLWNKDLSKTVKYKDNYKDLMTLILTKLLDNEKIVVHLVPHVVCENNSPGNDYELCYFLYNKIKNQRLILSPFFIDPIKAKNYISALDFFTGSRMHACIAAFSSGVPVYPISYSRKFIGLFNETLNYDCVGDLETMENLNIIENLLDAIQNREILKEKIYKLKDSIIELKYKQLMSELAKFMSLKN